MERGVAVRLHFDKSMMDVRCTQVWVDEQGCLLDADLEVCDDKGATYMFSLKDVDAKQVTRMFQSGDIFNNKNQ